MEAIENMLAQSAFFAGIDSRHLRTLAGCASTVQWKAGEFIFHEGDESSRFFILRSGKVAVEINVPGRGPLMVQTVEEGEVLSWSWVFPPYRKQFDARAMELTRAIAFDGESVRQKCQAEPELGYEVFKRLAVVIGQRLHATRLQLLDFYAAGS